MSLSPRTLGTTSPLTVPALGLGCMGMSEFYGAPDEAQGGDGQRGRGAEGAGRKAHAGRVSLGARSRSSAPLLEHLGVDPDLVVDRSQVVLHLGQTGQDRTPVLLQQGQSVALVAGTGTDEVAVAADVADCHAGRAEPGPTPFS